MTEQTTAPRIPAFAKALMRFQAFLLRRNWMGALGDEIMVITVAGRRTGRAYSTPIGYLRDGDSLIALTNAANPSNWYRNALHQPEVMLNIRGRDLRAHAEPVRDEAERRRIFELYKRERAANFKRLFGVPLESPAADLDAALATRTFIRFRPIH